MQDDTSSIYSQSILEENEDSGSYSSEMGPQSMPTIHSVPSTPIARTRAVTPSSEKINLLRQQMEQNRAKMVEREQSQRGIEELVTQLKSKFETSQMTLEKSVELGRSMSDLSFIREFNKSDFNISSSSTVPSDNEHVKNLEMRIKELEAELLKRHQLDESNLNRDKFQHFESKIMDLEENLKEKESIIDARTQAVSLLTENLTMKGKNTVDLLEETKQEMFKMQTNFVNAESNMKDELERNEIELNEKLNKISNLEEVNDILETARYDLTVENADLKSKLESVQEYSTKISELSKLNQSLMNRISDLENQKYEFITDEEVQCAKIATFEESDKYKELTEQISSLECQLAASKQLKDSEIQTETDDTDHFARVRELEALLQQQTIDLENCREHLAEKTVEYDVLNANFIVLQENLKTSGPKTLFSRAPGDDAEIEVAKLKKQLEDSNKSQIKTKLKIKQLQKQIDTFKKTSNVHQEVGKLTDEVQTLTQKIAELEEEKGNLQLHLVNYDGSLPTSELASKIKVLETTCHNQTTAIQLLEEQKAEVSENLSETKSKLAMLESQEGIALNVPESISEVNVSSEMVSIELEEKIDKLEKQIEQLNIQNESLRIELEQANEEKKELQSRLDNYASENYELLDKIEKLSIEKVSSAESIEIVDNLTQQEKLEIEEYHKSFDKTDDGSGDVAIGDELNDSLIKLREESSELMEKIELFTTERREVMEKLDALNLENQKYLKEIEVLKKQKQEVEDGRQEMEVLLKDAVAAKQSLEQSLKEVSEINMISSQASETASSPECSPAKLSSTTSTSATLDTDRETYEKALASLDNEIQNFSKIKDKNAKARLSKKLSTEAKNLHTMMTNLLSNYTNLKSEVIEQQNEIIRLKTSVDNQHTRLLANRRDLQELNTKCESLQVSNIELEEKCGHSEEGWKQTKTELADYREWSSQAMENMQAESSEVHAQLLQYQRKEKEMADEMQIHLQASNSLIASVNEIAILKELVSEQKAELIEAYQTHENEITMKTKEIHDYENRVKKFEMELAELQQQNSNSNRMFGASMEEEIKKLNLIITENNKLIEEQKLELGNKQESIEVLNNQMTELYKTMEENQNTVLSKDDEIHYMQELLDAKNDEIKVLNEKYTSNCNQLQDYLGEIEELRKQIQGGSLSDDAKAALELRIQDLLKINTDLENKLKEQLDKLRKFAANFKKKSAQCVELENKLKMTEELQDKYALATQACAEYAEKLRLAEEKENRMPDFAALERDFNETLKQKSETVSELQTKLTTLEAQLNETVNEKTAIITELQHTQQSVMQQERQLDDLKMRLEKSEEEVVALKHENSTMSVALTKNSSKENEMLTLFDDISFLENKNLELLAMIKKLEVEVAAKTAAHADLQQMLEILQKDFSERDVQLQKTEGDLKAQNIKIEKCKAVIKEKNKEIQKLRTQLEAAAQNSEDATKIEDLNQQIVDLQQLNKQMLEENQRKMEVENSLELCEIDNNKLRNKLSQMEEGLSYIEQRRASLDSELQKKTSEFVQNEDMLLTRLNALAEHDMVMEKNLIEVEKANSELQDKLCEAQNENRNLLQQVQTLESSNSVMQKNSERVFDLENENTKAAHQVAALQNEIKKIAMDYDQKLARKHAEIDELESELSSQLQKIEAEKKAILEKLEKSREENAELQDEVMRLRENIHMLEQIKTDFEREITWTKLQNETLSQENLEIQDIRMQFAQEQNELKDENESLRQQICDMESMRSQLSQNQTDDQVLLQNETKKLKDLLDEKETMIVQYQQRLLQMQMNQTFATASSDPFTALIQPSTSTMLSASPVPSQGKTDEDEHTRQLEEKVLALTQELETLKSQVEDKVSQNQVLLDKLDELQLKSDDFHRQVIEFERVLASKNTDIIKMGEDINNLKLIEMTVAQQNVDLSQQLQTITLSYNQLQDTVNEKNAQIEELQREHQQQLKQTQQQQPQSSTATSAQTPNIPKTGTEDIPAFSTAMFFSSVPTATGVFDDFASVAQPQTPVIEEMCVMKKVERVSNDAHNEAQAAEIKQLKDELLMLRNSCDDVVRQLDEATRSLNECNQLLMTYQQQVMDLQSENDELRGRVSKDVTDQKMEAVSLSSFFDNTSTVSPFDQPMSLQVVTDLEYDGMQPVSEEMIVPKKQYLCHPSEQTGGISGFDDSLDGWGADEAMLEAQHQQQTTTVPQSLISPNTLMQANLREQEDRIQLLEADKKHLQDEIASLQSKSGKIMKKLKEYKSKNDELTARGYKKSPSVESTSDLDLAIQEELNSQLKTLETKYNETKGDLEKEKMEKDSLAKRVDVLTSAHDRMTEMKERQDGQVEMLHLKVKQLTEKLKSLEDWDDDNSTPQTSQAAPTATPSAAVSSGQVEALQQKINELQKDLEDVRVDNEELQALLEEEKSNQKIYEEKIKYLQSTKVLEDDNNQERIEKLEFLLKDCENNRDSLRKQLEAKDGEIHDLISKIDMFSLESAKIKSSLEQLSAEHRQKTNENQKLTEELQYLMNKNASMSEELGRVQTSTNLFQDSESLTAQIHDYEEKFQALNAELQYKNSEILHLNQKIQQVLDEDQTQILVSEILEKNNELNKLRAMNNKLENEKTELENNLSMQLTSDMSALKKDEIAQLNALVNRQKGELQELQTQKRELDEEKRQMELELQTLNDQVMSSFVLEDRMKGTILELDTKNIEILELKRSLQQYQNQEPIVTSITTSKTTEHITSSVELEQIREQYLAEKMELEQQHLTTLEQTNAQWSMMVDQRGNDVAESWKQHLQQRENEFAEVQQNMQQKINELQESHGNGSGVGAGDNESTIFGLGNRNIPDSTRESDAEVIAGLDADVVKMKEALESQELEIVTLKEQLAIRSAEYARLAARVDPFGQMSSSSMVTVAPRRNEDETVPRNELDLALYMLHQRDMRCEELTLELMNLLEERDTLQLKLSNSLRQNEENKIKNTAITSGGFIN